MTTCSEFLYMVQYVTNGKYFLCMELRNIKKKPSVSMYCSFVHGKPLGYSRSSDYIHPQLLADCGVESRLQRRCHVSQRYLLIIRQWERNVSRPTTKGRLPSLSFLCSTDSDTGELNGSPETCRPQMWEFV